MAEIDLTKLAEPFAYEDIEFRVMRAGIGGRGLFCIVVPYITARGVQNRFDDVCGPANWKLERPILVDVGGKPCCGCGISLRINEEWVTKWGRFRRYEHRGGQRRVLHCDEESR